MRPWLLLVLALLVPVPSNGEPVRVRFEEGLVHGFLALRTLDGRTIADGDLFQSCRGSRVTSRLVFRFRDGSSSVETVTFDQRGPFRLLRDRVVQKGPSFPAPMDQTIDVANGHVVVRTVEDGKEKLYDESMDLPPDLANGLVLTLLKNLDGATSEATVSFLAATPKPRLVKLKFRRLGEEPFATGGTGRKAVHYLVKVDVPGLAGVVAGVLGKEPPDSHVWVLHGDAPAFVRSEAPLYAGGPLWRIDLVSPTWPKAPRVQTDNRDTNGR